MLFDLHPKKKPASLYGRRVLLDTVKRHVLARRWLTVLGTRMVGKTSLLHASGYSLQRDGFQTLFVNLWGCHSIEGLLEGMLQALAGKGGLYRKMRKQLARLEGLSVGPVGVTIREGARPTHLIWRVLGLLGEMGGRVLIVLDEVQELRYSSGHLTRLLANVFSTYPDITFCFSGSQFGLIRALHSPRPGSPLYGRTPATLSLRPFDRTVSMKFLQAGFKENEYRVASEEIEEVIDAFGGIPGWLTFYGNCRVVSRMNHADARSATESEAFKTSKQSLEHYLEDRSTKEHSLALLASASGATWSEIKRVIETRTGRSVNPGSLKLIVDNMQASQIVEKRDSRYVVIDPVMRRYLLSGSFRIPC